MPLQILLDYKNKRKENRKMNILKQTTKRKHIAGKDTLKISVQVTLTQNEGFKSLEIINNKDKEHGYATTTTIADIFTRNTLEDMFAMLRRNNPNQYDFESCFSMCETRNGVKYFKTIEKAISDIQRKMQTQDYRGRELLIVIVRHQPNQWIKEEQFSVYCEDRKSLKFKS